MTDNPYNRRRQGQAFGVAGGRAVGGELGGLVGGLVGGPGGATVGKAIGGAVGGEAGRALGGLGGKQGIAKPYQDYIQAQFGKAASGASMVDDRERLRFQQQAQQAAEQAGNAQTQAMNRAAMAGGPVQAGALRSAAADIANVSSDAQVKASGVADQVTSQLDQQRRQAAIKQGRDLMGYQDQRGDLATDQGFLEAETLAKDLFESPEEAENSARSVGQRAGSFLMNTLGL